MTTMTQDAAVLSDDDTEAEEAALIARRMAEYSAKALAAGLPIDKIFVVYTRFAQALSAMDRVFQIALEVNMPHGFCLIGPTGSGKSAVFKYFRESLPKSSLFSPGYGAIGIRAAGKPTSGQLVAAMLRAYRYPFRYGGGGTLYSKRDILFELVRQKRTRLVFVDEAHRLLRQVKRPEHDEQEPEATQFLRDLMDECHVGLLLAGTEVLDQLRTADSHLEDRVVGRQELTYFAAVTPDWRGVLKGFQKQCITFNLDFILAQEEAQRLHVATGGNLRRLKRLLTESVLIAVDTNKQTLDSDVMKAAFIAVHGKDGGRLNPYA